MHTQKNILFSLLILVSWVSALAQTDSSAAKILLKTFEKYDSLEKITFSCRFTYQQLNTHDDWDTLYAKNNKFTAIQNNAKHWYPVISLCRDQENLTEFYRFRNAIIRSKWALKNHKIRLIETCNKLPVYILEYRDVPLNITSGGDSLVRQTIYIDTLTNLITSIQTVVAFNETQIALFSLVMDSIDTHEKIAIPEVFQLNNGMLKPRDLAPYFSLKNTANQNISLDDFKGKLLLLDFWYAACKPCIKASVGLENLHTKYAKRGLVVLGMNTLDSSSKIKRHNRRHHISYESLLCSRDVKSAYKIRSYPSFYLIDGSGNIVFSSSGYYQGLEKDLELAILQAFSNR